MKKQTGEIYDPVLRRKSLTELHEIFSSHNLINPLSKINNMLERYTENLNNDIVFLLDISESMKF